MEELLIDVSKSLENWFKLQSVYKTRVIDPENEKSENIRIIFLYDLRNKSLFGNRVMVDISDGYTGIRTCINPLMGLNIFNDVGSNLINFILKVSNWYKYYSFETLIDGSEVVIVNEDFGEVKI